jgi:hypothetical protein
VRLITRGGYGWTDRMSANPYNTVLAIKPERIAP